MEPENITAPQLAMEDLGAAIGLLEFAYQQGVFTDWTMLEQMIGVRNRLSHFLSFLNAMDAAKNYVAMPVEEAKPETKAPPEPTAHPRFKSRDDSIHPSRY